MKRRCRPLQISGVIHPTFYTSGKAAVKPQAEAAEEQGGQADGWSPARSERAERLGVGHRVYPV